MASEPPEVDPELVLSASALTCLATSADNKLLLGGG
eukprot:CAMPEP_0119282394 /NCGR_PEP_ID=MMETSP1329-20130426/26634_1 /TAXON_ID=114041 /ORGANISM="Genus nov. species nov., Strain RCC1024" /LENGTH=35 /DNA_ID= /DNA_START= /DNA_END= /DNA_ORIENTATION=